METWLEVLQAEVAASSLAQVAEKLGLSRTTISQVCNEKYPGGSLAPPSARSATKSIPVIWQGYRPWWKGPSWATR